MPLRSEIRVRQTDDVGRIFEQAATARVGGSESLTRQLQATARIQGALCLALGAELHFFEDNAARRSLGRLRLEPREDVVHGRLESHPLVPQRLGQLGAAGLVTPAYRPKLASSDASLIAFRSVVIPVACAWQAPAGVPLFLARIMAREADDFDPAGTIGALEYLQVATRALEHADDWQPLTGTETASPEAWLRAELAMLCQVQVDTSQAAVKASLLSMAERLANSAFGELQELILARDTDEDAQAELLLQLTRRTDEWRAEAVEIVERYDTALPVLAVS